MVTTPVTMPPGEPNGNAQSSAVHVFVSAVRARLDDLTADEIEELTGGLEADLTEALAGSADTPWERYGDPAAYADELRSAAGLPPRTPGTAHRERATRTVVRDARAALARHPSWAPTRDFLFSLRPVWWVVRAVVAVKVGLYVLGSFPLGWAPQSPVELLLLIPAIFVSVQLGRSRVLTGAQRRLVTAGNVLAVAALIVAPVLNSGGLSSAPASTPTPMTGLLLDGERVENVFPYDAQGRPLTDVRLYDDRGRPLITAEEWESFFSDDGSEWQLVPRDGVPGPVRNAFPLQRLPLNLATDPEANPITGEKIDAPLPYSSIAPIATPSADPESPAPTASRPAATQSPSPTPTTTPAAAPTASP